MNMASVSLQASCQFRQDSYDDSFMDIILMDIITTSVYQQVHFNALL